jgi:hypothetical protein
MTITWIRRHATGITALVVRVGGAWTATDAAGGFRVVCGTLEQAQAEADERVAVTFPHDCAQCPPWQNLDPGAQ